MDKYEYNLKLDQMKSRYAEEKYDEAADIADTINWNKVKNVNGLVKAGEVYEKVQRYEESREVLLMAYDRSPIGRMIIYRLAEVAVKMKDFQAAQDYYDEFVEIAPHDTLKYVLRYDIQKAQGASYEELIPILEELKEQEYTEEWAYELAYLYEYLNIENKSQVPNALIRELYHSTAELAIVQMQDILELGNEARMNYPSTVGHNWRWRMTSKPHRLDNEKIAWIRNIAVVYHR